MALTAAQKILLGTGLGVGVILATGARGDPPIDIAGGSIHASTRFWHKWHEVESNGASYSVVQTPDNTKIVIKNGNGSILLACTASQWVVSLYPFPTDTTATAKLCTNHQCVASDPIDSDGNIYLNSYSLAPTSLGGRRKQWKHSAGVLWWELEFEDDFVHINKLELVTAGPRIGTNPCPASWPNAISQGVPDYHWHVQIGQIP